MKKLFTSSLLFFIFITIYSQPLVGLQQYATGFTGAISGIWHANDGRLFVTEQMGYIRIIQPNGSVSARPFLDIHSKVTPQQLDSVKEQGLLGLAFSPNFATDGYFYVHYTGKTGVGNVVVARYRVSSDPDSADAASEQILLTVFKPYTNHNGGCLQFGPDGFLYIGLGDGGGGGDPGNRAQNLDSLQGKILRLDVSGGGVYSVPSTNPFVNNSAARAEIWAYGLRNPWRFSFDRLTNDLWIGDVGEQTWEEVDFQTAGFAGGADYGWKCYEGFHAYDTTGCLSFSSYVSPAYNYSHASVSGCSITGGYVYRGTAYPSLYGYYFYADYCNGTIYSISADGNFTQALAGAFNGKFFSTFGENNAGELFMADHKTGTVYQLNNIPNAIGESEPDIFQTNLYPIPNTGNFTCDFTLPQTEPVEMKITDISGKEVYHLNKTCAVGKTSLPIEIKNAAAGVYLMQLKAGRDMLCKRVVVQRN